MLGQLIALGAAAFTGLELSKWWKAKTANISVISGHAYSIGLNYTQDPGSPVTQAQMQSQLDAQAPGGFSVLTAAMTPGPQSGIRQMAISVVRVGPTGVVPATLFTSGWPASFGSVTVASAQDMGGPQGLAGTAINEVHNVLNGL